MKRTSRFASIITTGAVAATMALCLTGCGVKHEPVVSVDDCIKCHSANHVVDPGAEVSTKGAIVAPAGVVSVTTKSAEVVYVCTPVVSNTGKGAIIPILDHTVRVTPGVAADIQLEAGTWMLVTQVKGHVDSVTLVTSAEVEGSVSVGLN